MSKLAKIKSANTAIDNVAKWLDHIREIDQKIRSEVLDGIQKDESAMKYFLGRYEAECYRG